MLTTEEVLTRGVSQILPSKEDLRNIMEKKKITLYQGFDPSMPSLHLGHLVGLIKLRQFQKLGHKVIFLIGDFTGSIGDPTDKISVRKKLTRKEVLENTKNWKAQAEKVLDFTGFNKAEIRFNSEWNDKVTFKDLVEISSNLTVQQLIERDMFQERIKLKKPIFLHEFLYPVAQGYDSVVMKVDLEVGGSDQIFNMLIGRTLVKALSNKEKYVLATKLLTDKEGKKVGKTTGNAMFLDTKPDNFYSGIMSFPDSVILLGFELLTEIPLKNLSEKIKKDPMGEKKRLAFEVVELLWGEYQAKNSEANFTQVFQKRQFPNKPKVLKIKETSLPLLDLVFATKMVSSRSEAKRLISQNAIEINNETENNPTKEFTIPKNGLTIKIGKKSFINIIKG